MKKIWNIISSVLVGIFVIFAVFLMGSRLMGFQVFNVISGSMEPEYSVGDLIYVKEVNPKDIEVGTPITFVLNEELAVATHRVVEIDADNQYFYTKGDANETVDSKRVHFNNVIGVPKFHIPLLGYVSDFIQNPPGIYITIASGLLLILAVFLPDFVSKKRKDKDEVMEKEHSDKAKVMETETCILCGEDTGVLVGIPADARKYYINGVGQVCESCYSKLNSQMQSR